MSVEELTRKIRVTFPDAYVEVHSTRNTGQHYAAVVVEESFRGLSRVRQHQKVYEAVKPVPSPEIHALQLRTFTPEEWKIEKHKEFNYAKPC